MPRYTKRERMRKDVLEGRPVSSFEIVDVHGHLGYWFNFNIPWRSGADMVRMMDIVGVRCVAASAHSGISADYRLGNDQIIEAMGRHPGRILGYCSVNPNYPHREITSEIHRCLEAGMIGLKFHPSMHRHKVTGDGYRPAWEIANDLGLCVLVHTGAGDAFCGIGLFEEPAKNYPNAKILLGHSGFGYEGTRQCIELALKYPNLYLDITCSISYRGLLERIVNELGADRVLYGTDMPFMDCRPQIGRFAFSDLNDEQLELALGGNARRLFGL